MPRDWGTAVVIDPLELRKLEDDRTKLRRSCRWRATTTGCLLLASVVLAAIAYAQFSHATKLSRDLSHARRQAIRLNRVLGAMASSHQRILSATEQTPLLGTKSWGRRFTVTNYLPRSPKYGKFNNGLTATLTRAEPAARIVAVDPALIPYGSWVWVEGRGWYRAEDCGSGIKGFRLDVLVATEKEAMQFGKQERFAIVVPGGPRPCGEKCQVPGNEIGSNRDSGRPDSVTLRSPAPGSPPLRCAAAAVCGRG